MNRAINDITRLKHMGEFVFPTAADFKDTGNGPERATAVITIFDPCNPQYGLTKHFGRDLSVHKDPKKTGYLGPYRSIHLVMNRDGDSNCHYGCLFNGASGKFTEL